METVRLVSLVYCLRLSESSRRVDRRALPQSHVRSRKLALSCLRLADVERRVRGIFRHQSRLNRTRLIVRELNADCIQCNFSSRVLLFATGS